MESYHDILEASPDAVVVADTDGRIRFANTKVEPVLGYAPEELEGEPVETLLHDPDREAHAAEREEYYVDPYPRPMGEERDLYARRKDGTEIPVEISLGPFTHDGETLVVATIVDVSEKHDREAALRNRTDTLETLHEATRTLLKTTDREAAAELAVESIQEVLGFPIAAIWLYDDEEDRLEPAAWTDQSAELVDEHPTYGPDDPSISWEAFERGRAEYVMNTHADPDRFNPDTPIRSEFVLPLGRYGVLNVGATEPAAFDSTDLAISRLWASTVTMVFVRIERERQLRGREDDIARERDRLEEFASIVSHDLRNPLTVAAGHVELAREALASVDADDGSDDELAAAIESLEAVERALSRMEALVADLLQLARQDADATETEPVSLADLATESWESVDTADAELVVSEDAVIRADRSRLGQAFENLFRNAVEHAGSAVRVTVGALADGFFVADDGPGIPEDRREEVFEPGVTTNPEGTGFGLNIVAEMAEAHGWTVELTESETGGARFELHGVTFTEK
ncbi:hypothetical protein JCM17823_18100 [Halorubrum gandharaense]